MEIKEIEDKQIWENFLIERKEKTFLQSWNWGEFQKQDGNKIWRIGVYDGDNLIACCLIIKIIARRGTFIFVPHGPNIKSKVKSQKSKVLKVLLEELKEIAEQEKASFIRISPIEIKNEENIKIFKDLGFRNAPIHMHPEVTWELDITAPEENILANMRKTTRYLIRQAQKNQSTQIKDLSARPSTEALNVLSARCSGPDIQIIKSQNIEDLKIFNALYKKTALRHKFVPFSLDYLENEFFCFQPDNQIFVYLGKYKNQVVSSVIIVFWQNIAFYHHGASLSEYNKIPVSYLLQWEAIKEAKKQGCQIYNFWGIVPTIVNCKLKIENFRKHPWAGLSLFKMGFGGYKKEYVKTQDFIISKKYWLNYLIEKIRKTKRNL